MFVTQHGETWQKSSCELCACDNGREKCYTQPCEQCPPGTARGVTPGECCGQCKPGTWHLQGRLRMARANPKKFTILLCVCMCMYVRIGNAHDSRGSLP